MGNRICLVRDDITRVLLVNLTPTGAIANRYQSNSLTSPRYISTPSTIVIRQDTTNLLRCFGGSLATDIFLSHKVSLYWNCRRRNETRAVDYDSLSDAPPLTTSCAGSRRIPSAWICVLLSAPRIPERRLIPTTEKVVMTPNRGDPVNSMRPNVRVVSNTS